MSSRRSNNSDWPGNWNFSTSQYAAPPLISESMTQDLDELTRHLSALGLSAPTSSTSGITTLGSSILARGINQQNLFSENTVFNSSIPPPSNFEFNQHNLSSENVVLSSSIPAPLNFDQQSSFSSFPESTTMDSLAPALPTSQQSAPTSSTSRSRNRRKLVPISSAVFGGISANEWAQILRDYPGVSRRDIVRGVLGPRTCTLKTPRYKF
ncbi:hypothetical protein QBC46DRAFT_396679 [Diplogelasinospora grovesii]|uniref:Uncharacterized protein n=1 Tax=Diplogelasinospora grovesii TaxID=303347 RepID=A0AAN6N1N5_9PEZI|nr:hypothetical protein QBC46DRAFT_396679 [Diplogelasinospora grovesii]